MSELPRELRVVRAAIMDDDRVLLMQRAKDDSYRPGAWELPGGKIDSGERPIDALKREISEETGLRIKKYPLFILGERNEILDGKNAGRVYVGLFYAAKRLGGGLTVSDEHNDARWVYLDRAMSYGSLAPEMVRALSAVSLARCSAKR